MVNRCPHCDTTQLELQADIVTARSFTRAPLETRVLVVTCLVVTRS